MGWMRQKPGSPVHVTDDEAEVSASLRGSRHTDALASGVTLEAKAARDAVAQALKGGETASSRSLAMPIVTMFSAVVLCLSTYLFVTVPPKVAQIAEVRYETRCSDIHARFVSLVYDTHVIGARAFELMKESMYDAADPSMERVFFPTSEDAPRELLEMRLGEWAHGELSARLSRHGDEVTPFVEGMMLAPIVRNKSRWEASWADVGPRVFNGSAVAATYTYTIRDVLTPFPVVVWGGESAAVDGMYAPWSFYWSYADEGLSPYPFLQHGANALAGAADPELLSSILDYHLPAFSANVLGGTFVIYSFYPILAESRLRPPAANTSTLIGIGIKVFTHVNEFLAKETHSRERLELVFASETSVVKGSGYRRGKVALKVSAFGVVAGDAYDATVRLKCSQSKSVVLSDEGLVRLSCGIGIAVSLLFCIVFAVQSSRERAHAAKTEYLARSRIAAKATCSAMEHVQRYINHELKNRCFILREVLCRQEIPRELSQDLVDDTLFYILNPKLLEGLAKSTYSKAEVSLDPSAFVERYAEIIRLVHGGRSTILCQLSADGATGGQLVKIDPVLLRACLMGLFNCATIIGLASGPVSFFLDVKPVDGNAADLTIVVSTRLRAASRLLLKSSSGRTLGSSPGAQINVTRSEACAIEAKGNSEFADIYESHMALIRASVQHSSLTTPDILLRTTETDVELVARLRVRSASADLDDSYGPLPPGAICVLDDSGFVLKMVSRRLATAFPNHKVDAFSGGDELVKRVTTAGKDDPVILCLLDENLGPGMIKGSDVAKILLDSGYKGMLVSISANSTPEDTVYYLSIGMHGLCEKGSTADKLKTTILEIARIARLAAS